MRRGTTISHLRKLGTISVVTEAILDRMRPIWEAADRALRSDSDYVIQLAEAASKVKRSDPGSVAVSGV